MMIGCIVVPTLLLLIIQAVLFPITLHSYIHINEVSIGDNKPVAVARCYPMLIIGQSCCRQNPLSM